MSEAPGGWYAAFRDPDGQVISFFQAGEKPRAVASCCWKVSLGPRSSAHRRHPARLVRVEVESWAAKDPLVVQTL